MSTAIDMTRRNGQYQGIEAYHMISGGNAGHVRPAPISVEQRASLVAHLVDAGFVPGQMGVDGATWYHEAEQAQARICVSVPHMPLAPAGEVIEGTIGIEMWDEPHVLALLGVTSTVEG